MDSDKLSLPANETVNEPVSSVPVGDLIDLSFEDTTFSNLSSSNTDLKVLLSMPICLTIPQFGPAEPMEELLPIAPTMLGAKQIWPGDNFDFSNLSPTPLLRQEVEGIPRSHDVNQALTDDNLLRISFFKVWKVITLLPF